MHEIVNYEEIEQLDKLTIKHMEVIYNHDTDTLEYNRKLHDGPGNSNYGLEVCKSLHLDNEFIEYAYIIRQKYGKYVNKEFLSMSTSKYNSRKIKTICEICKNNIGEDIHHINPQREVNKNNFINNEFHKNHMGNLISVCSKCHDDIHKSNKKYRKTKTTKGVILKEL
jgi:DNA mismatch repair protein MutS